VGRRQTEVVVVVVTVAEVDVNILVTTAVDVRVTVGVGMARHEQAVDTISFGRLRSAAGAVGAARRALTSVGTLIVVVSVYTVETSVAVLVTVTAVVVAVVWVVVAEAVRVAMERYWLQNAVACGSTLAAWTTLLTIAHSNAEAPRSSSGRPRTPRAARTTRSERDGNMALATAVRRFALTDVRRRGTRP